jgi:PBP1b-binding outer membrane lipoprotein LpoB
MSHIIRTSLLLAVLLGGCAYPQTQMEPVAPAPAASQPPPPTQTEVAQKKPTQIR